MAVILLGGTGLAAYHVGVEQGVLALPESCLAAGRAQSIDELRQMLAEAPPRCDQVALSSPACRSPPGTWFFPRC